MTPIKGLIRDGAWVKCIDRNARTFQIRVLNFQPLDFAQVDSPEESEPLEEGAVRWIMDIEAVNTNKVQIRSYELTHSHRRWWRL